MPVKLFFLADFFPRGILSVEGCSSQSWWGGDVVGVKVLGMYLSRLATRRTTPPLFLQLYFFKRLILEEKCLKSCIMMWIAFCGNGFIHLNIAEIHEGDIGGQKTCAYFVDQSMKCENSALADQIAWIFLRLRCIFRRATIPAARFSWYSSFSTWTGESCRPLDVCLLSRRPFRAEW